MVSLGAYGWAGLLLLLYLFVLHLLKGNVAYLSLKIAFATSLLQENAI